MLAGVTTVIVDEPLVSGETDAGMKLIFAPGRLLAALRLTDEPNGPPKGAVLTTYAAALPEATV